VSAIIRQILRKRKRDIERRLAPASPAAWPHHPGPVFSASNIHYEVGERTRAVGCGGIGAIHQMVQRIGLAGEIDKRLRLLKIYMPYHESDHVLNVAYNVLCGGTCLDDLELRRNDEVYLNALGAPRVPDPTTAGDFCRRFCATDVQTLMDIVNDVRLGVWKQQPDAFFDEAIIDADGSIAPTTGEHKRGMDISYTGEWGYHPLVVSLANTREELYLANRPGNRPSHEGAAQYLDRSAALCRKGGFRKIVFRGDTDFSQTVHLDRWDEQGIEFFFGMDAMQNLRNIAEALAKDEWEPVERPAKYEVKTEPRRRRENEKEKIIRERGFKNLRLQSEDVAEFEYRPGACKKSYRVIVLRKNISVEKGEEVLFPEVRYFFWITNNRTMSKQEVVLFANRRCDQENIIEQLKNGVNAMRMPEHDLVSNWAYMVMASLAWNLKAWYALLLPEDGAHKEKRKSEKTAVLRMEFKRFLNCFMLLPCQVVRTGRRVVYKLLSWNPWLEVFFRALEVIRQPLRC